MTIYTHVHTHTYKFNLIVIIYNYEVALKIYIIFFIVYTVGSSYWQMLVLRCGNIGAIIKFTIVDGCCHLYI